MDDAQDIARKRSILHTVRVRFSPQLQPLREAAVDRMVEQTIYLATNGGLARLRDLQRVLSIDAGGYRLHQGDMRRSLDRLVQRRRVRVERQGNQDLYQLSNSVRQETRRLRDQAETQIKTVVSRLFSNATHDTRLYEEPFLKLLSLVFSSLGEECAKLIKGELPPEQISGIPLFTTAINQVKREFQHIDHGQLTRGVIEFFETTDPLYDAIKWHMSQNYYIAKAVGLDPSGDILSIEVFQKATFWLDTNTIIAALEPVHRHHGTFRVFARACKRLNIQIQVCQISLDELERWLDWEQKLISNTIDQIPKELSTKIQSLFYERYCELVEQGKRADLSDLFESFKSPMSDLKSLCECEIELVDDPWFRKERDSGETKEFAAALRERSSEIGRGKSRTAAVHDAQLLRWVEKVRGHGDQKAWAITFDTVLPRSIPPGSNSGALAIGLGALLQWFAPLVLLDQSDFSTAFAEMIKYRVLPQDRFFQLEDFLIFHEMHMSCKELPAADVEGCIRYIKSNAGNLDPTVPEDREKLAYEVSRFFTDPGRRYKQEIGRLEGEKKDLQEDYDQKLSEAAKQSADQVAALRLKHEEDIAMRDVALDEFRERLAASEDKHRSDAARRRAWVGLGLTIGLCVILEAVVIYYAVEMGKGSNVFQKIVNAWQLILIGVGAGLGAGWFIIGKKGLELLGWPFKKVFKSED